MAYCDKGYQHNVSKMLYQLGEHGLRAPDAFTEEGTRLGQKVFLKLQTSAKKFPVASVLFSGSFGKKTAILKPDLDLVVVVNNFTPPLQYKEVLDEFEDVLFLNERELRILEGSIKRETPYSVQFIFENGIEVDLLPASNLEDREVYEIVAKNPQNYYNYSLCLAKKQVAFVKSHPSNFVHCLIRLLKFWKKSLIGLGKLSGGSYMMEVVGVAAAEEEEDKFEEAPDVLRAFTRAIDWFCKLNKLKLAFREASEYKKWVRVPTNQINASLIPSVVGTKDILAREFFIIDPANPYNDLLGCQKAEHIRKLMEFAAVTRKRLSHLMDGGQDGEYFGRNPATGALELNIMKLFQSQPPPSIQSVQFPYAIPGDFLANYTNPLPRNKVHLPDLKVRSEQKFSQVAIRNCVESFKWDLVCLAMSATQGKPNVGERAQVQNVVAESTRNLIKTSFNTAVGSGGDGNHEKFDVTISVPYRIGDDYYAIKCSFSW